MDFNWAIRIFDSYWFIRHQNIDHLQDPEFIKFFTHKLTGRALEEGAEALCESLSTLRGKLYPVILDLQKGIFDEGETLKLLNEYIVMSRGGRKVEVDSTGEKVISRLVFEPDKVDEAYVLSEFAMMWYILLFEKDRTRIHVCEQPECACLFLDESKNHSKRHCSEKCSNVMKMRRHRGK